jgi:hypothetical protein
VSRAPVLVACALWGALEAGCHSGELRPEPPSQAETWPLEKLRLRQSVRFTHKR